MAGALAPEVFAGAAMVDCATLLVLGLLTIGVLTKTISARYQVTLIRRHLERVNP